MAHLEVQPKKRSGSWIIWLLLLVILGVVLFFVLRSKNGSAGTNKSDSASAAIIITQATGPDYSRALSFTN